MPNTHKPNKIFIIAIPLTGMFLFIGFYILSALLYPGGSYKDPYSTSFSFLHNYLCDLLDTYAINGELNIASTMARIAFGILCFTVIYIWYQVPNLFKTTHINQHILRISGILSMITAMFLASAIHDTIVYIAGVFGFIALIFSYIELYKHGFYTLLFIGILCVLLISGNYYIYHTRFAVTTLPLIQKITFISCISWFLSLMVAVYKRQ